MELDPALLERFGIAPIVARDCAAAEQTRALQTDRIEARWHAACQMGRCRYATQHVDREPGPVDTFAYCGGYHGARHVDDVGVLSWRWRPCVRHRAWWERRRVHLAQQRQQSRKYGSSVPKEYAE